MTPVPLGWLSAAERPRELGRAAEALWLLRKGGFKLGPEWTDAHALCQAGEGERLCDLAHALAHWIEGDMANAAYWRRRAGGGPPAATIEAEAKRIAGLIAP